MSDTQIKAVIFDLDGTLVDSYQAIYLGFQYVYAEMGLTPLSYDAVKEQVGRSLQNIFTELLRDPVCPDGHRDTGRRVNERVPQAITLFRQKYAEVFRDNTHLLPGAKEVLTELHNRGIKLSVATNKLGRFSRAILENLQVANLFSAVIGEGDCARNKPDPEMIYLAIEKMALPKEQTVLVGDSDIDIQSAHHAGIRIYAVPSGTTGKAELAQAQPTAVLDRLPDLLQYI